MLIHDLRQIGNRLLALRKDRGLTQTELAEKAGLADRTYADIERGTVNMRLLTLLQICDALNVLPNDVLYDAQVNADMEQDDLIRRLNACAASNRETAIQLLRIYLNSLPQ